MKCVFIWCSVLVCNIKASRKMYLEARTVQTNEVYAVACKRSLFHNYADLLPAAVSGHVWIGIPKLLNDAQWEFFPSCVCLIIFHYSCHHSLMQTLCQWLMLWKFFFLATCQQLGVSLLWMFYASRVSSTRIYLATPQCLVAKPQTF